MVLCVQFTLFSGCARHSLLFQNSQTADRRLAASFQFPSVVIAASEISSCLNRTVLFIMHFISISLPGLAWFGIPSVYLQWRTRGIRDRVHRYVCLQLLNGFVSYRRLAYCEYSFFEYQAVEKKCIPYDIVKI